MKLIGYHRIKGEKDGRSWDFYQLVIDKEEQSGLDSSGVQLLMQRRNGSYSLPSVTAEVWNNATKNGVRLGNSVNLYFDYEGHVKLEPASDFIDIR